MKYFLSRDNSAHWYIVYSKNRSDWNKWLDLDDDDERSWIVPDYAQRLNGRPSIVEFNEYEIK